MGGPNRTIIVITGRPSSALPGPKRTYGSPERTGAAPWWVPGVRTHQGEAHSSLIALMAKFGLVSTIQEFYDHVYLIVISYNIYVI